MTTRSEAAKLRMKSMPKGKLIAHVKMMAKASHERLTKKERHIRAVALANARWHPDLVIPNLSTDKVN